MIAFSDALMPSKSDNYWEPDFFPQRPNFQPDWPESSAQSWQHWEDLFTNLLAVHCQPGRYGKESRAGNRNTTTHRHTSWWGGDGVGGGGAGQVFSVLTLSRSYSWDSGYAGVIESKWRSSVLWFTADCITIVGAAKSLVLHDKRFNHTKVWCIFIFIDLQAS